MSDYVEILDTQIEPDAPLTAVLAGQWRDNCIAIAEGAAGAPKVRGIALGHRVQAEVVATSGFATITGMAAVKAASFVVCGTIADAGPVTLSVGLSTDNGATWTSSFVVARVITADPGQDLASIVFVEMDEGIVVATSAGEVSVQRHKFTAATYNAVRFSLSSAGTNRVIPIIEQGREL